MHPRGRSKSNIRILVMWALYSFVPYTNVVENETQVKHRVQNMTILIIKMPRFGEGEKTGRETHRYKIRHF